jgi:hypothetical protein
MRLSEVTPELQKEFFKSLVTCNFSEAAIKIGLGDRYTNASTLRGTAYKLYKDILAKGLDQIGIDQDVAEMVRSAVDERRMSGGNRKITESNELDVFEPAELLDPKDMKGVIVGGRNKAAMLLHKKMDRLNKNKKMLDATPLSQIATMFGILFDKSQILTGQATENIAVMSKISKDMTPEETLEALVKMREAEVAGS